MGTIQKRESGNTQSLRQSLPLLKTAKVEDLEIEIEYKTGAIYKGQVFDNKKIGKGVFTWPNGAKYEGEFIENARQGKGIQTFEDGTVYEGEFSDDMRHGAGIITWPNQETYNGQFFKDRRHGYGIYKWPNGSSFKGMFYMDRKEGYGSFEFSDGTKFQGLYKSDERFGPGVQTYTNATQDVGLWDREKLVKLCSAVNNAFTIRDTEFADSIEEDKKMYIYPEYFQNRTDVISTVVNSPPEFDYRENMEDINLNESKYREIFYEALDSRSLAVDIKAFDEAFFNEASKSRLNRHSANEKAKHKRVNELSARSSAKSLSRVNSAKKVAVGVQDVNAVNSENALKSTTKQTSDLQTDKQDNSVDKYSSSRQSSAKSIGSVSTIPLDVEEDESAEPVLVWNKTSSCVSMQKHYIRHEPSEKNVTFNIKDVINGNRSRFAAPGIIEQDSAEFLQAAMEGDLNKVSDFLVAEKVHVNVADKTGHTALLGASLRCHEDVINILLDNGADVNKLNDEGISALAACHIFFYPSERFKYNVAENYGQPPPEDAEREQGYDVNEAVKGLLSKNKGGLMSVHHMAKKPTHAERLEDKKISEYRKHYASFADEAEKMDDENTDDTCAENKTNEKQLGTLKFKRAVKINVDEIMVVDDCPPESDRETSRFSLKSENDDDNIVIPDDFTSGQSMNNYPIEVSNHMIERCATSLSTNDMVVGRSRSSKMDMSSMGTVRRLAIDKREHIRLENTIRLLLRRGADPNAAYVPMPVLFFAVKASDVEAVRLLLMKGASTKTQLPESKCLLTALHIAVALPGEDGVLITELLLNALADPDARALQDNSFLNTNLEEEWSKDVISEESQLISGGRTPLHIACARDDNYKYACQVVHLLLEHHANPNLLCNGHSPLSLAIISGNDLAIDELLSRNADPNLVLTHGVGNALCVATSTEYEHRRDPETRLKLIDKLVRCGANILAPIPIGPKRLIGTAVDYAYYMYNLDRRIAHMPYHALSHAERETYNARKTLLAHVGDILRGKAVEQERLRLEADLARARSGSQNFVYLGTGETLPEGMAKSKVPGRAMITSDSKVSFAGALKAGETRKPLFRYCYECGRSVGVRLTACTRCKQVFYCSKACKVKAWNSRHKDECIRIGGLGTDNSPTRDQRGRADSPTPQTDADEGLAHSLRGIMDPQKRIKGRPSKAILKLAAQDYNKLLSGMHLSYKSKNTRKEPPFIDPLTGLIRLTDPITGKITWLDNYSFV